jgi:hypothetical protein
LPNSIEDKTIDVYFIKQGQLVDFRTVGRKANLDNLLEIIKHQFVNQESELKLNPELIDEIRIVTSWIFRQQEKGKLIYTENKTHTQIYEELSKTINNFEFIQNHEDNINFYI